MPYTLVKVIIYRNAVLYEAESGFIGGAGKDRLQAKISGLNIGLRLVIAAPAAPIPDSLRSFRQFPKNRQRRAALPGLLTPGDSYLELLQRDDHYEYRLYRQPGRPDTKNRHT